MIKKIKISKNHKPYNSKRWKKIKQIIKKNKHKLIQNKIQMTKK